MIAQQQAQLALAFEAIPPKPPEGVPDEVTQLFEQFAFQAIASGKTRFSADAILHRIRWYVGVERQDGQEFKCNDHWTASLARYFMKKHPQHKGFFETRRSREDD